MLTLSKLDYATKLPPKHRMAFDGGAQIFKVFREWTSHYLCWDSQVAASMKKDVDAQIPNYPNLPSKLLCRLHNVTLHVKPLPSRVRA